MKISPEIANLKPYKAGKPIEETKRELGLDKVYKLASNENPLGPSPKALQAIIEALGELHRYPDASFYQLRNKYADFYGIDADWLSFGNGSNEVIDLLIRLFCETSDSVLSSQYSFIAYKICSQAARCKYLEAPMGEDLKFDLLKLKEMANSQDSVRLIFIANPNNPTGTYVPQDQLEAFVAEMASHSDTYVVIDEAYNEFVRAEDYSDGLALVKKYPNVILSRTLSKVYGIAGLRMGALIARPEVVELFNRIRNPFNVNSLAQAAAMAVLEDEDYLKRSQQVVWQGLDYFYMELESMGLRYWPSQANFVLFEVPGRGDEWFEKLLHKGVIVRPLMGYGLTQHLRLSVGLPEENEKAIEALQELLQ